MKGTKLGLATLAVALVSTLAGPAEASFLDSYGFNPRALGMASAHTAVADDFTALYYNPAGLTASKSAVWGAGLLLSRNALDLSVSQSAPAFDPLEPPNATAITFGGLFPLGGEAAANRVALAFALALPTSSLLNAQALDPATPHWYMYQTLPERLVAMIGIGVLPVRWLSIGASAQFLASVTGELDYELDIVAGRFTRKNVSFDIQPVVSPIVGIELRPIADLRVGFVWRGTVQSDIDFPVILDLTGLATLDVATRFSVHYTPHVLTLGASYLIPGLELLVSADLDYALWSKSPDPSAVSIIDVSGEILDGSGLGNSLDAPAPGQDRAVDLAFSDVLVPRVGVERRFDWLSVRAGYALRPSPAPVQTSGNNYIDGTAHTVSLGASAEIRDPLELLANPITFDFSASWLFHPTRDHPKMDASDPIGDVSAGGSIFVFGFAFRYRYGESTLPGPDEGSGDEG